MKLAKRLAYLLVRHPIALKLTLTVVLAVAAAVIGSHGFQTAGDRDPDDDFLL